MQDVQDKVGLMMSKDNNQTNSQVKVTRYTRDTAEKKYQIHELIEAEQNISEIAQLLGRQSSKMSQNGRGRSVNGLNCNNAIKHAQYAAMPAVCNPRT